MTAVQLLWHLLNFTAPALAMALLMPLAGRLVMGAAGRPWLAGLPRSLLHALAGLAVLALGLWWQGHDGRLATYAALAGVGGVLEWGLWRGWRSRP